MTYQIWQVEGHFQNFNFSCWIACEAVFGFGRTITMTIDYGQGYCRISIVFLAHGRSRPSKTSFQFYFACMWNCEDEVELSDLSIKTISFNLVWTTFKAQSAKIISTLEEDDNFWSRLVRLIYFLFSFSIFAADQWEQSQLSWVGYNFDLMPILIYFLIYEPKSNWWWHGTELSSFGRPVRKDIGWGGKTNWSWK